MRRQMPWAQGRSHGRSLGARVRTRDASLRACRRRVADGARFSHSRSLRRAGRLSRRLLPRGDGHAFRFRRCDRRAGSRRLRGRRRLLGGCCWLRNGLRGRSGLRARRQEAERIEVTLGLCGDANAEVDVRTVVLRRAADPDSRDGRAFGDLGSTPNRDRAQVKQRDGVAVWRPDRHRPSATRNGAGEAHGAAGGGAHGPALCAGDVDAAVLTGGVGVAAETERLQYRPIHRPGPGGGGRGADQKREEDRKQREIHLHVCLQWFACGVRS
jgi:hypothetical protein